MEGEKVVCHLRKGDGLKKAMRWECWLGWCIWWKVQDREQSLENTTRKNMLRREIFITFDTERTRW